jgi:hypothetical protein
MIFNEYYISLRLPIAEKIKDDLENSSGTGLG